MKRFVAVGLSVLAFVLAVGTVQGAVKTWDGGSEADSNWTSATNWVGDTAPAASGDSVVFDANSTNRLDTILGQAYSITSLTVSNPAGPVSVSGGSTLTLTGATGLDMSGTLQDLAINTPVTITANPQSWAIAGGHVVTLTNTLSGTGQWLYKMGAGTLTANGTLNTYVSIYNGTLVSGGGGTFYQFLLASGTAGSTGAFTQTGGTIAMATTANAFSGPSAAIMAFWSMSGGTLNGSAGGNWYGNNNGGTSTYSFTGGTFNWLNNLFMPAARGSATMTISNMTVNIGNLGYGLWTGEAATQTVTVNSGAVLSVGSIGEYANASGGHTSQGAVSSTFNFNGGQISPRSSVTDFMQYIDTVNIQDGGAIVDTSTYNITIPKALLNAGAGGLIKNGTGTLTLSGANTYTGLTTVVSGALMLGSGGRIAGAVQGNAGITFGGAGTIGGAVTMADGASLLPGGAGTAGTMVCGDLVLGNGTNKFDLKDTTIGGNNDLVTSTNNLAVNGAVIAVNALTTLTNGNYALFRYTNSLTGSGFSPVVAGNTTRSMWTLDTTSTPHVVYLNVGGSGIVTWQPSVSGDWDIQTSTNWLFGGFPSTFYNLDQTLFDDTGAVTNAVNIMTAVTPGSVIVNSASNYTFTGTGKITGATGLAKSGMGTLHVTTTNDYTGATTVNAGSLIVEGGALSGGGAVVVSGTPAANAVLTLSGGTLTNSSGNFIVAQNAGSVGSVNMSAGSLYISGGDLGFGNNQNNTATGRWTQVGGVVSVNSPDFVYVGGSGGAVGDVRVSGGSFTSVQSIWLMTGNASLTISNTAVVTAPIRIGYYGNGATINLDGGTLVTGQPDIAGNSGHTFNFNGGKLKASSATLYWMNGFSYARVKTGGAVLDSNGQIMGVNRELTHDPALGAIPDGGLTKMGAGTLVLWGGSANTYTGPTTINAGTLQIGNGDVTGGIGGMGDITNNASLVFNRADLVAVTNLITGFGSLTKLGTNALALFGSNSYTGTTTVSSGALAVYNTSASGTGSGPVNVASNAMLTGSGSTMGIVTAVGGATIAAGDWSSTNGAGTTLTIGSVVVQSNATVAIRLKGGASDNIQTLGNITLQPGAKLNMSRIGGMLSSGRYTILSAGGTISGTFAGYPEGSVIMAGASPLVVHYTPTRIYVSNLYLGTTLNVQ